MTGYVIRRVANSLFTLLLLSLGIFMLIRLIPGDPVVAMLGEDATPQRIADLRAQYGLDEPLVTQFISWLGNVTSGDFGQSVPTSRPVTELIFTRFPVTILLASLATLLTIMVAVPMGVTAATRRGQLADKSVLMASLVGISVPSFFLGILLMLVFAVQLRWFPTFGFRSFSDGLLVTLKGFVLPALSLGLLYVAIVARMSRASMLEVLSQDYIVTAEASGLSRGRVRYKHALKNALIPVVTVVGLNFGALLGGSVITEQVFNLPGLGTLLLASIDRRDYPVIQAIVLLISVVYIVINLLVDLLYGFLDPRVRYAKN
jgi:peptide/nickel transport system permease protein